MIILRSFQQALSFDHVDERGTIKFQRPTKKGYERERTQMYKHRDGKFSIPCSNGSRHVRASLYIKIKNKRELIKAYKAALSNLNSTFLRSVGIEENM